jgi:hypothetical protein
MRVAAESPDTARGGTMNNHTARFARFEELLGRSLSMEERRVLTLWEMYARSEPQQAAAEPEFEEGRGPVEHEGRFKVTSAKGVYEVLFVCPTLMVWPVVLESAEDVIAFLTQDPINLDSQLIQQALASAQTSRPVQISQNVWVSEPLLRSMGFEHR